MMRFGIQHGLVFLLSVGIGVGVAGASQSGKKEHTFRGTVEKVDANARTLTVNGENVPGWMAPMTMTYHIDQPATLTMKPGDRIVAKVYDGDYKTLHNVQIDKAAPTNKDQLPPLSYVCNIPGQEGVLEERPGDCPQSRVPLTPVRLVTAYSCLKVESFIQDKRGMCPVDRSELVPITAALYFTCGNDSKVRELEPGACPDGSARTKIFERRSHGDHNPRHGGQFFMADDNWHHLEGAFVRPNVFRVYFYDDFTRPLAAATFSATMVKADADGKVLASPIVIKPGRTKDRNTLEAAVPNTKPPVRFVLRVKFSPTDKERRFDFAFSDYSREPSVGQPKSSTSAIAASVPQPPVVTSAPPTGDDGLPTTKAELLRELSSRAQAVATLLAKGDLGGIWYSAIGAKDVALALEQRHMEQLTESQRDQMRSAVRRLTMAAWQLDAAADQGNRERLVHLHEDFSAAVGAIRMLYGNQ